MRQGGNQESYGGGDRAKVEEMCGKEILETFRN